LSSVKNSSRATTIKCDNAMDNTIETTPEAEVIAPQTETTVENTEVEVEQTISDMLPEVGEKPNLVPESVFLAEKKTRKALEKELANLKKQYEDGDVSNREVSNSINSIAEKHNIDKEFLGELVSVIKSDAEKELENKFNSKFESKDFWRNTTTRNKLWTMRKYLSKGMLNFGLFIFFIWL
jgi:hypothetical protein